MNRIFDGLFKTTLLWLLLLPLSAMAGKYQDTVEQFREAAQTSKIFDSAYGYAVFPSIGKAGIGLGAAYGRGKVYVADAFVGDVTMSQLSIGFQMGGQAYSQIIFFKDKRAFDEFTTGNFEFSAQANAVAVTLSASIETSTKGNSASISTGNEASATTAYYRGMAVYSVALGGLMYEASLGGQRFNFRSAESLPGYIDISIDDIRGT